MKNFWMIFHNLSKHCKNQENSKIIWQWFFFKRNDLLDFRLLLTPTQCFIYGLQLILIINIPDDCRYTTGRECKHGACLNGQCHCNDGYGGKGCNMPDDNECKVSSFDSDALHNILWIYEKDEIWFFLNSKILF